MASSHASAQNPYPPVSHWFGWLAANHLMGHAHLISYLVVTGELAVGIGLTLGLFLLVINGIMILVASVIVPGFHVYGMIPAFWGAVVLALLGMLFRAILHDSKN